jgi:FixJ family two-component response regulator
MGFAVEAFSCGPDFLNSSKVGCTACLIADVHMPEMTGLDLYHHLSSTGHTIPTILITAYPSEGVRTLALEAGVMRYLVKPFAEADLLDSVRIALDQGSPN